MPLSTALSRRTRQLPVAGARTRVATSDGAPARARDAAAAALDRGETHYTDRPGIRPLRAAVARDLDERYGLGLDPDSVVITCGDTEARFVAVQQLLPPGGALCAITPDRERILGPVSLRGGRLADLDEGGAATAPDASVYYLDAASGAEELASALGVIRSSDAWLIFDTTYAPTGRLHPKQHGLAERTVTIGGIGFTDGMEGWRVGFLASPPSQTALLRDFKQALTICTTNLSQWAALALLEEPS